MHRCLICYRLTLETSQGPLRGDEIKRYAKPRKPDIKEYNLVIYDSIYMKFNSKQSSLTHDDRKQKRGVSLETRARLQGKQFRRTLLDWAESTPVWDVSHRRSVHFPKLDKACRLINSCMHYAFSYFIF